MNKFKLQKTRHDSLLKPIPNPDLLKVNFLSDLNLKLLKEIDEWRNYCRQLKHFNNNINNINKKLISRVTVLEDVIKY